MSDSNQQLIEQAHKIKNGIIFLLKINNLPSVMKDLGFCKYKNLISGLHKEIMKHINCYTIPISHDELWIVSQFNIKSAIDDIVRRYILNQKMYLSTSIEHAAFYQDDDIEELKFHMFSNLKCHHKITEPEKTYNLYEAISKHKLSIALQPIVTKNDNIYCYECLLREPNNSFSSTAEIVHIAEQTGLINILDEYILELVTQAMQKDKNIILSINISCDSINNLAWAKSFIRNIEKYQIANNLIVEITETAVKTNYTRIAQFIDNIHQTGAKVSLDDFGTGYTSFVQLKSFSVDFVKIDGFFIKNILYDKASSLFVKSVIDISHSLGMKVIAECVENKEIANILKDWNTDYLQGFYFGKPFDFIDFDTQDLIYSV